MLFTESDEESTFLVVAKVLDVNKKRSDKKVRKMITRYEVLVIFLSHSLTLCV